MKKKILVRAAFGFPMGITIGYLITIFISLLWAEGYYSPCVPALTDMVGSEICAVLLQALLSGILGMGFAAGSVIWEIEEWSIIRQTGSYFLLTSVIMMPIAYITHWMEHSLKGVLGYFGIFAFLFVIFWVLMYGIYRKNVRKMNQILQQKQQE